MLAFVDDIEHNKNWVQHEFASVNFGDKRLTQRLIRITETFIKQPNASIPKASTDWAETKATYNFFKNEKVTMTAMLENHVTATANRCQQQDVVLCVQDTTTLNYTSHPHTRGLGTIGSYQDKSIGIMVHDTMAFTVQGVPLGLIDLQTWTRPTEKFGKSEARKDKPIYDKESNKWLHSFQAMQQLQQHVSNTMLVNICDREADIFELFEQATQQTDSCELLVRASHNRRVEQPEYYLWDFMANQEIKGIYKIEVPRKKKQPKRDAELAVRYAQVTLKRPNNIATPNMPPTITVWAVWGEEINPPNNGEAVSWLLLTTIPIESLQDAIEKVQWYMIRWQIELYHRVLKSGCKVEDRQLQSAKQLINCLMLDVVVAWRILLMTKLGREVPELPCTVVFEEYEWKALYCYHYKTTELPDKELSLNTAIRMVAKLGGFLDRKGDGEPGSTTLWHGLIRLNDIAETWRLFNPPSP
jgi:hypothetical protein